MIGMTYKERKRTSMAYADKEASVALTVALSALRGERERRKRRFRFLFV